VTEEENQLIVRRHEPVMLQEVLDLLNIRPDGRYVDGTLGLAGHAVRIVERLATGGKLLGLDVDPVNIEQAKVRLQPFEDRTITRRTNFRGLQGILRDLGWTDVNGMLFDLGISSAQLDDGSRGFSFQKEAPLDMRLDPGGRETALSLLRKIDERALTEIFIRFGEGRYARKISQAIKWRLNAGRLKTTKDVADVCRRIIGERGKRHVATRIFLALRATLNNEIGVLEELLANGPQCLAPGGRMVVISFHSLEDALVKNRFRDLETNGLDGLTFRRITKKPLEPSAQELAENPRSRSAKLRVLERVL